MGRLAWWLSWIRRPDGRDVIRPLMTGTGLWAHARGLDSAVGRAWLTLPVDGWLGLLWAAGSGLPVGVWLGIAGGRLARVAVGDWLGLPWATGSGLPWAADSGLPMGGWLEIAGWAVGLGMPVVADRSNLGRTATGRSCLWMVAPVLSVVVVRLDVGGADGRL